MKTLRFVINLALGILLPLAIQLWVRRRLSPAQRSAAWNTATWGAALYAFGPLSLVGYFSVIARVAWFQRPRPVLAGALGGLAGLVAAALVMALIVGADWLLGLALGLPE